MRTLTVPFLFAASIVPVRCAPQVLDSETLRLNALDAQMLNTEFRSMNQSDPCDCAYYSSVSRRVSYMSTAR